MKRTKPYDHICIQCHTQFQSYSFKSLYCSQRCKDKARKVDIENEEKRKKLQQPDITIADIAKMASDENMTYGQYVAKYGTKG